MIHLSELLTDNKLELIATTGVAKPWIADMARELLAYRRAPAAPATPARDDVVRELTGLLLEAEKAMPADLRSYRGLRGRISAALSKIAQDEIGCTYNNPKVSHRE